MLSTQTTGDMVKKIISVKFGRKISNPGMFFAGKPLLCDVNKHIFISI